jgi:RodZ C-terminal domain
VEPEAVPRIETPSPEAIAARELTSRLQADADVPAEHVPGTAPSRRVWWLALGAAVLVAGVWLAVSLSPRSAVTTEAAPPKATPSPEPAPSPQPVAPAASTAASEAPAPAAAPAHPLRVTLTAIRPVWLRVTVDGSRAHQGELPAGETLSFDGDRTVVVRSGDAGGVQATVNGTDRGALGLRGWPLTVSITPAGIEPLTPTRPEP